MRKKDIHLAVRVAVGSLFQIFGVMVLAGVVCVILSPLFGGDEPGAEPDVGLRVVAAAWLFVFLCLFRNSLSTIREMHRTRRDGED